ncbi:hypothetical protein G6011_00184 [Alternaria panax]|uniref:Uncharacterized protein n=1 Tax=Alternaria panax TaxID=48097 RepID=A0AAD4IIQ3_9PLEO|nr:hypothetical protein G6011_00184 [Alternaria panax]
MKDPYHELNLECEPADAVAISTQEAVLVLSVAEVIVMAVEELVMITSGMITPFQHDILCSDPRKCMSRVQSLVLELHSFGDELESRLLELGAGPYVLFVQAALATKRFARSATWTDDHEALDAAYQNSAHQPPEPQLREEEREQAQAEMRAKQQAAIDKRLASQPRPRKLSPTGAQATRKPTALEEASRENTGWRDADAQAEFRNWN